MAQSYDNCVEKIVLNWIKQILWVTEYGMSIDGRYKYYDVDFPMNEENYWHWIQKKEKKTLESSWVPWQICIVPSCYFSRELI